MNVFQIQESLRTLPDDHLMREMQQPSGAAPQYLVLTEINRRQQLRSSMGAQMPTTTVAQDMMAGMNGQPQAPGGQTPPMVPQVAQMPGMPGTESATIGTSPAISSANADTAPMKGFADGGMVEKDEGGFFNGLNPLMGGIVPWALDKMGDDWDLGAIGLINNLFNKDKKNPGQITEPQLPGQVQRQPGFADGAYPVQEPSQADIWKRLTGSDIPEWLKRKVQFEAEAPAKSQPDLSGPDWLQGIDPTYRRIVGPESGGKDVNSIASNSAYIGPGQMNADSYKDALRYAKKRYPDAQFPAWNEAWKKTTPKNRPKDYPSMRQWAQIGEGYVDFIRGVNKGAGVPTDDAHIYGGWNAGVGNLQKLFKNPDVPIKKLLPADVIEQNKFNPNATYSDMISMWGNRLDRHSGPAAKEVMQTPSKKFFYVPEGEDLSMSQNPMIDEMYQSEDFYDQLGSILDGVSQRASQDEAQSKLLQGVGSYLQEPMQAQQAMRQVPVPQQKPMAPPPRKKLSQDDGQLAADILNDMQFKQLQAQRKRKERQGFADGGVVGGDTVVIDGKVYKRRNGALVDQSGSVRMDDNSEENWFQPGIDAASGIGGWLSDAGKWAARTMSGEVAYIPSLQGSPSPRPSPASSAAPRKFTAPNMAERNEEPEIAPPGFNVVDENGTGGTGIDSTAPDPTATLASISEYYNQLQKPGQSTDDRMEKILNDLQDRLSPDKERDKWMAIADFGGKLASGTSPWFAQNFGPATQAGIASMRGDRDTNYDNALKLINARNMEYQTRMGRESNLVNNAVQMRNADVSYQRAVTSAAIRASQAMKSAAEGGRELDLNSVTKIVEMAYGEYLKTVPPEQRQKALSDAVVAATNIAAQSGWYKGTRYGSGVDSSVDFGPDDY